jgi:hypothetical protein
MTAYTDINYKNIDGVSAKSRCRIYAKMGMSLVIGEYKGREIEREKKYNIV